LPRHATKLAAAYLDSLLHVNRLRFNGVWMTHFEVQRFTQSHPHLNTYYYRYDAIQHATAAFIAQSQLTYRANTSVNLSLTAMAKSYSSVIRRLQYGPPDYTEHLQLIKTK